MNRYQILIIVLCCIVIVMTVILTVGYIRYNQDKKEQDKFNKFIFHKCFEFAH